MNMNVNGAVHPSVASSEGLSAPPKEHTDASTSRLIPVSGVGSTAAENEKTDKFYDRRSTYRDYSHVPAPKVAPPSMTKESTFPVKLHKMLSSPQFRHFITWLPHGRAWKILDHEGFEEHVLPLFFKHGHYSSFARQVNGWGFRRITHGDGQNAYYHEVRPRASYFGSAFC